MITKPLRDGYSLRIQDSVQDASPWHSLVDPCGFDIVLVHTQTHDVRFHVGWSRSIPGWAVAELLAAAWIVAGVII